VLLAASLWGLPASAQEAEDDGLKLDVYGDFRFRIESDWGTNEPDGAELEGRTRARVRARLGATFSPDDHVTLGLRIRTGLIEGQQVANITIYDFDGNNTGDADFLFDKWFLQYRLGGLSAWVGRNSIPYWKQNQLYWDDEVIPVGFGATYDAQVGTGKLQINGGLFSLPAGMQAFSGRLLLGQVMYDLDIGSVGVTAAAGVLAIAADTVDPDRLIYLDENGDRDYTTLQASVQTRIQAWTAPLHLGVDFALNTEGYDDAAAGSYTELHRGRILRHVGRSRAGGRLAGRLLLRVCRDVRHQQLLRPRRLGQVGHGGTDPQLELQGSRHPRDRGAACEVLRGGAPLPGQGSHAAFPDLDAAGGRESTPVRCELLVLNTKAPRVP
jgi:hypothetical protein